MSELLGEGVDLNQAQFHQSLSIFNSLAAQDKQFEQTNFEESVQVRVHI